VSKVNQSGGFVSSGLELYSFFLLLIILLGQKTCLPVCDLVDLENGMGNNGAFKPACLRS
jgi:hypothetical protein